MYDDDDDDNEFVWDAFVGRPVENRANDFSMYRARIVLVPYVCV